MSVRVCYSCILDVQLLNVYSSIMFLVTSTNHISSVPRNFFTPSSSMPPPSGSTASIHRDTAMVCFTSFVLIHTRPFTPVATSRGNRDPSKGSRKWFESSNLPGDIVSAIQNRAACTYILHICKLHFTRNPPFSSPKPSALRVCASKHSSSGSISLCANDTRAYSRDPT